MVVAPFGIFFGSGGLQLSVRHGVVRLLAGWLAGWSVVWLVGWLVGFERAYNVDTRKAIEYAMIVSSTVRQSCTLGCF